MDYGLAPCHIHCCLSRLAVCDRDQSCPLRVARRPACHLRHLVYVLFDSGISPCLVARQEIQSHDSMVASPQRSRRQATLPFVHKAHAQPRQGFRLGLQTGLWLSRVLKHKAHCCITIRISHANSSIVPQHTCMDGSYNMSNATCEAQRRRRRQLAG